MRALPRSLSICSPLLKYQVTVPFQPVPRLGNQQATQESNPDQEVWKLLCYRYTSDPHILLSENGKGPSGCVNPAHLDSLPAPKP